MGVVNRYLGEGQRTSDFERVDRRDTPSFLQLTFQPMAFRRRTRRIFLLPALLLSVGIISFGGIFSIPRIVAKGSSVEPPWTPSRISVGQKYTVWVAKYCYIRKIPLPFLLTTFIQMDFSSSILMENIPSMTLQRGRKLHGRQHLVGQVRHPSSSSLNMTAGVVELLRRGSTNGGNMSRTTMFS